MEKLDQIFDEWKSVLDEPITKSLTISNLNNNSIMDTFITYENKVTASKSKSIKILFIVALVIISALLIFSLLTYFRGTEKVTYNLSEMVIGAFLCLLGIAAMIRNVSKIKFPDFHSKPTLEYLTLLRLNMVAWRTREKPALLAFVLLIPAGISLLVKSVFIIPFYYIFIPFFLFYLIAIIFGFAKNNPEFKAVLEEIDGLLIDLRSS